MNRAQRSRKEFREALDNVEGDMKILQLQAVRIKHLFTLEQKPNNAEGKLRRKLARFASNLSQLSSKLKRFQGRTSDYVSSICCAYGTRLRKCSEELDTLQLLDKMLGLLKDFEDELRALLPKESFASVVSLMQEEHAEQIFLNSECFICWGGSEDDFDDEEFMDEEVGEGELLNCTVQAGH